MLLNKFISNWFYKLAFFFFFRNNIVFASTDWSTEESAAARSRLCYSSLGVDTADIGLFAAQIDNHVKFNLETYVYNHSARDFNADWSPITYKEIISPIDFTKESYWFFSEGTWIKINISKIYEVSMFQSQVYSPQLFFIACTLVIFIWSSITLTLAKTVEGAVTSFFTYVLLTTIFLFYISSDYVAILLFIVYVGAVLIFFVFILFTTDPKWFFSQNDFSFVEKKRGYSSKHKTFFYFSYAFNLFGIFLFFFKGDFSFSQVILFKSFLLDNLYSKVNQESHPIFTIGEQIFADHWVTTTFLAFQLLIVLVLTIFLLNKLNSSENYQFSKPSFWNNFFYFKRIQK
jgi:NADH:ubiquinone oxidoreductase subunit 6 (subunit J)